MKAIPLAIQKEEMTRNLSSRNLRKVIKYPRQGQVELWDEQETALGPPTRTHTHDAPTQ